MSNSPALDSIDPSAELAGVGAPDARPKRSALRRVLLTLSLLALAAAAFLWWKRSHPGADAVSPLEATTSAGSVLVPAESELIAQAPTSAGSATAPSAAPDNHEPGTLTQIAIAAASGSGQALDGVRETLAQLTGGLSRAHARIDAVEANDRAQSEQIATLRSDVDQLKTSPDVKTVSAPGAAPAQAAGLSAEMETGDRDINVIDRPKAATPKTRTAARRPNPKASAAVAQAPARSRRAAQPGGTDVLAIDTWAGKPSVAMVTSNDGRPELRFLAEGEAHQGLVLRQADSMTQKARFSSQEGGELTLAPKEPAQ